MILILVIQLEVSRNIFVICLLSFIAVGRAITGNPFFCLFTLVSSRLLLSHGSCSRYLL